MPAWDDPDRWAALREGSGCPICSASVPDDVLVELDSSWVTAGPTAALSGYVCVVSKAHVVEPFELDDHGTAFWTEAMRVARALDSHLRPVKMNYEIHGNSIPHLHMHLYPRKADDGFERALAQAELPPATRSATELDAMRAAIAGSPRTTSPLPAVGVVVRRGDEVLLARHFYHADKRYVLIAGYVEAGETIEEAAVREVREETGLEVSVDRLLGSYPWQRAGFPVLFVACETHVTGGSLRLSDELDDVRWHRLDALPEWPADFPVAQIMARLVQEA